MPTGNPRSRPKSDRRGWLVPVIGFIAIAVLIFGSSLLSGPGTGTGVVQSISGNSRGWHRQLRNGTFGPDHRDLRISSGRSPGGSL
jgi:hypothetical protein